MTFRGILIATTVVLILALVFIAARWAQRNFVPSPTPMVIPKDAPIQTPGYYETMAERALRGFAAISPERRRALIANLKDNLQPLDQALTRLRSSGIEFLCIGEQHMASTRRFVADRMVPVLAVDVLYLEVADDELPSLMQQIDAGLDEVPLLGADVAAIVRAARNANPGVVIVGIDESHAQQTLREYRKRGSRDESITANFRSQLRRGKRHAALFGSLHCAEQPNWMYVRIREMESRIAAEEMHNINVIGTHQDGALEAFLFFLTEIGIEQETFMVPDTSALDPLVFQWFSPLTRTFGRYRSIIVFVERVSDHTPSSSGKVITGGRPRMTV